MLLTHRQPAHVTCSLLRVALANRTWVERRSEHGICSAQAPRSQIFASVAGRDTTPRVPARCEGVFA